MDPLIKVEPEFENPYQDPNIHTNSDQKRIKRLKLSRATEKDPLAPDNDDNEPCASDLLECNYEDILEDDQDTSQHWSTVLDSQFPSDYFKEMVSEVSTDVMIIETPSGIKCAFCPSKYTIKKRSNIVRHCGNKHATEVMNLVGTQGTMRDKRPSNPQRRFTCRFEDQCDYLKNAVLLTADTCSPFSLWDHANMQRMTIHFDAHFGKLTGQVVQEHCGIVSGTMKDNIRNLLSGRLCSLKLDIASRRGRNYLGINAQIEDDCQIKVIALAIRRISSTSTVEDIEALIIESLSGYGLTLANVISISTDAGATRLRPGPSGNLDNGLEYLCDNSYEYEDNTIEFTPHGLVKVVSKTFPSKQVGCVADTFDMAVNNYLREGENGPMMAFLCSFSRDSINQSVDHQPPMITCNGRSWISRLSMLESLLRTEAYAESTNRNIDFVKIKKMVEVLRIANHLVKQMEKDSYLVGDFVEDLVHFEIHLEEIQSHNNEAAELLKQVLIQKKSMTNSPSFVAALFMDHRFNTRAIGEDTYLSTVETSMALDYINTIHKQLMTLRTSSTSSPVQESTSELPINNPTAGCSTESESERDRLFNLRLKRTHYKVQDPKSFSARLENLYKLVPGSAKDIRPLNHLKFLSGINLDLKEVGLLIQSSGAAQVAVHRSLSDLAIIRTEQENAPNEDIIEDLCLIKVNYSLC